MTVRTHAIPISFALAVLAQDSLAQSPSSEHWFTRVWGGYSSLADTAGEVNGFQGTLDGELIDVTTSAGFTAGAGVGYRYNQRLAVEFAWEYRTNDSETSFNAGPSFSDGNYASNTFFLNAYYFLDTYGAWEPYLGAGLAWIQEVDIDLEGNGPEQSFSGDGDTGLQVIIGSNYRLSNHWSAHGELRYGSITGIDLENESGEGSFQRFDYEPFTLQIGVTYKF